MEKTIQDEARWCESNNAKIIYSIDSEKESRRRNREGGRGERKKVSDALNCATINLPIRKTDELFVNNGVTSIYLWAPPSCKGIYNDNHRRRRRLDRTERGKQFDPAALMQVLMIADIERERGVGGFRKISSDESFLLFIKSPLIRSTIFTLLRRRGTYWRL